MIKMHIAHMLLVFSATIQVYYLYRFIYSIPLRYSIPESEVEYFNITQLIRDINDSFHGTHKQKHLRQPHPKQTKSDNNTALTYTRVTTPDVVDRF